MQYYSILHAYWVVFNTIFPNIQIKGSNWFHQYNSIRVTVKSQLILSNINIMMDSESLVT